MKKLFKGALFVSATTGALAASAQTTFGSILGTVGGLINTIIPILIAAGLAYFIYGVVKFIMSKDGDEKGTARKIMINGVIGLFVIVSVWGLIGVIQSTFGIGAGGTLNQSQIPGIQLQ